MMAIAAIAMFCAGTAMARETLFIKNSDKYVTQSGDDIYQMKAPLVQVTKACSEAGALDVKNGSVTAGNGYVDGAYKYGNVTKYECNTGVKTNYNLAVSQVKENLTKAGAGRAVAFTGSVFEGTESGFFVLNEDMKTERVYKDCPSPKVAGDKSGVNKDKTKCYEKVEIYDVKVACGSNQKAGDGKSRVYMNATCASLSLAACRHSDVIAYKDRCYYVTDNKFYSESKNGNDPSTNANSAVCLDNGYKVKSSGTYHTGEKDSVTAASNKPYCVKSTNTSFYGHPSERPYVDNYSASVTRYEGCTYTNLNGTASDKIGSMGESIIATQNGNKACYMEKNTDGCFEIGSAFELYAFANIVNNARSGKICAKLTSDITVNENVLDAKGKLNGNGDGLTSWTPMNVKSGVKVALDGNGHTISGLYFNANQNYVGLFGFVSDSLAISNLGIKDSYFKGDCYVGGLVGDADGENVTLSITNSYNTGSVNGTGIFVGGLVGDAYNSTLSITNSYNAGSVSGSGSNVGGLVGDAYNSTLTITNSYNAGSVSGGTNDVGGLVGRNSGGEMTITNSYNAGSVSGTSVVGGLVGYGQGTLGITNSYNMGSVSGGENSYYVGGLVGYGQGTLSITNSYNAGAVSGTGNFVGGLVGDASGENVTLSITNSYNSGTVSGKYDYVGGLVGYVYGEMAITNSYNMGSVSGSYDVGGLVGYGYDGILSITNSYNAGSVSGSYDVGGLVGDAVGTLTITNSFFLATGKDGDNYGGTKISLEDFHSGAVAFQLHNYVQTDCEKDCIDGSVWGQDFTKENSLPDLSGKFVGGTPRTLTLYTFEGDTRVYPTVYLEGLGLELPTDLTRDGYIFSGWSAKENAASDADLVTAIAKGETGAKTFYAQWKNLNVDGDGCFEIASSVELYAFANIVNNASSGKICAKLMSDITVNDNVLDAKGELNGNGDGLTSWTPMNVNRDVEVALDGKSYTISGLYINEEGKEGVGLFGMVMKGKLSISNLGIVDSYFRGNGGVGSFVGGNKESFEILLANCYNAGSVSGSYDVGGLVGYHGDWGSGLEMTITNSYNTGAVSGTSHVGGLVGFGYDGILSITNSYNAGSVSGSYDVGGLVGYDCGTLSVTNSYNAGSVSGSEESDYVGGLVGEYYGGTLTITNSYNSGTVSGRYDVGGLVGYSESGLSITNSYNAGAVSGGYYVGGLVGYVYGEMTITHSFFLAKGKDGDDYGGTETSLEDFHNGTVAFQLHNYVQTDCEKDCIDGSVWGQNLANANSLPDFSGEIVGGGASYKLTLHTFEGKILDYPKEYMEQLGFELPTDLTSEGYVFLGWSAKENAASDADFVTAIAKGETGEKTFYAQWKKLNGDGCFEIASTMELYGFANFVNNASSGKICAKLMNDIIVNENVLDAKGELNGNGDGFKSWTPMNVKRGVKVALDGNVHTISGLYINEEGKDGVGLFGLVSDSLSISNLGIVDSYFKGGYDVGGLVGYSESGLSITNSYNSGTVSGRYDVGGLVGYSDNALSVTNSYNAGAVSGGENSDYVGGLVGYVYGEMAITNSYNAGSVSGSGSDVGGLVGDAVGTLTITNSFFLATGGYGDGYGGTPKTSLEDFHNGAVAFQLHDWCEKEEGSETCKEGGLNGSVWGQDLANANSLPDFSGSVGHKYGSIVFFYGEDDKIDSAYVDATSELAVNFPNNVVVSGPIKFKRTFAGSGYSTIMLPFTPNCTNNDCVEGANFYAFSNYENATVGVSEVSPSDLQANTPYLVQVAGATELVFKNGGTFNTTTGGASENGYKVELSGTGWTIVGTYEYKTWETGDAGLGKTYGFVGAGGNDASEVGKFKKAGAGAYIYPMRAYLEYSASAGRPAANGAKPAVASLPDEI
ncbi:InlB B-repeat-containing protein, partial [Fibrobacter sp.]|uniref:InlB B-repeat-containing protein n=1 Tax=Fibrobacter sp. TaxID=35828 RepID=UPI00388DDBF7